MSDNPTTSLALTQQGQELVENTVTLPPLGPNDVLVEVHYAAFNPTDMLAFDLNAFGDGAILGCDFAGIVKGKGTEAKRFSVGDRIAAFIWGGEVRGVGAYRIVFTFGCAILIVTDCHSSEFCIADERIAFKVPDSISLEQAATIPLSATTAFLALFSSDCLHLDPKSPPSSPVLVLGGSSTVGSFTNQLAKAHNIKTIATCSPRNKDSVLSDGASLVFDYNDTNTPNKIHESSPDLNLVFDTIGTPTSSDSAAQILTRPNSIFVTVRPGKAHTDHLPSGVKICDVFVFTAFPKEHSYRGKAHWPLHQENHDLSTRFFAEIPDLLSNGSLKPRPVKSMGKLSAASLMQAIELTRSGKISNEKLCFTVRG